MHMPWWHMGSRFACWCPFHHLSKEEGIKALEEYKKMLESEIEAVNKRIKELKK